MTEYFVTLHEKHDGKPKRKRIKQDCLHEDAVWSGRLERCGDIALLVMIVIIMLGASGIFLSWLSSPFWCKSMG